MNKLKKNLYIALFVLLGLLLGFILHAIAEIWYIGLLILNFNKYSMGLSWTKLYFAYQISTFIFLFLGAFWGYFQGLFWWKIIYGKQHGH